MVTLLITSLFILAFLAIAIYFWQKPDSPSPADALGAPPGRGLFIDGVPDDPTAALIKVETDRQAKTTKQAAFLERAKAGDKSVLLEAHIEAPPDTYREVLGLLTAGSDSDPILLSLVSYVTRHELPVTPQLGERFIDSYKRSPDRSSSAKTLHVAALSDDAAVYQSAVETALRLWRERRLTDISAEELRSILEGEFWILSAPTRRSGAGFLLKRALASARRELEAAHNG
ncbi:MAG TPA: hypothetical protein VMS31_05345 [Pyrinomonadaceae bacterium]|nr:hypothetical protein [Pyrinomonadaceae bacterium]